MLAAYADRTDPDDPLAGLVVALATGGAVALAAALFHGETLSDTVIVIASGGNIDNDVFDAAFKRFG